MFEVYILNFSIVYFKSQRVDFINFTYLFKLIDYIWDILNLFIK